jgi:lipoprotein NlpD
MHWLTSSRIWLSSALLLSLLAGCASSPHAPVIERGPDAAKSMAAKKRVAREPDWRPDVYVVQKGDTLYSIALEHGLDYRELAEWNSLADANIIMIGRRLKLKGPQQAQTAPLKPVAENRLAAGEGLLKTQPKPLKQPYSEQVTVEAPAPLEKSGKSEDKQAVVESKESTAGAEDDEQIDWSWPANGKMLAGFNDSQNAKGMDIAGKTGQAVLAAGSGKVVYSGSGLRGYGKLIIIKHNKTYLSAYAHNSQILVKEGQSVAKGQKIAEMGDSDADQVKLHFEIRRLGKPVDPLKYLPNSNEKSS